MTLAQQTHFSVEDLYYARCRSTLNLAEGSGSGFFMWPDAYTRRLSDCGSSSAKCGKASKKRRLVSRSMLPCRVNPIVSFSSTNLLDRILGKMTSVCRQILLPATLIYSRQLHVFYSREPGSSPENPQTFPAQTVLDLKGFKDTARVMRAESCFSAPYCKFVHVLNRAVLHRVNLCSKPTPSS